MHRRVSILHAMCLQSEFIIDDIALLSSIIILYTLKWNKYHIKSNAFYPINQIIYWLFINNFILLTYIGRQVSISWFFRFLPHIETGLELEIEDLTRNGQYYESSLKLGLPYLAILGHTGPYWAILNLSWPYWIMLNHSSPSICGHVWLYSVILAHVWP